MKKIVVAASLASLLAGAAFAADISFSYTGSNYFKSSSGTVSLDDRADCMSLEISNDIAGVVVDFDTETDDNGKSKIVQDCYYAWMNFGSLQVKAGSGFAIRDVLRVNSDAGDLESKDFERFKPGVITPSNAALAGKDSSSLTLGKLAMVNSYTNKDILPGTLTARLAFVKSDWNPDATAATTATSDGDVTNGDPTFKVGFAGSVDYTQEKVIRASIVARYLEKKTLSAGVFVSPLMVEKLNLTVGGTFAMVNAYEKANSADGKTSEWNDGATEFGVDLRARYQFTPALSVTTMHNLSSYAVKGSASSNREYADNVLVLWDMLNLTYKINMESCVGFTVNATFDNLNKANDGCFTGADVITSPYVSIKATDRISVTTSLRVETTGLNPKLDGHETVDVTIPVIFTFSL